MKRLIGLLLIAALAIILPFSFAEEATVQVGDIITLGTYEQDGNSNNGNEQIHWQVLAVEDDKVLVISEIGLAAMSYGTPMDVASYTGDGLYWETSHVRNWLNDDFLNTAFSDDEQKNILLAEVTTNDAYGSCVTQDYLFCLSIDEADQYFSSNEAMACGVSEAAKVDLRIDDGAVVNGYGNWLLRDMTSVVTPQQGSNFMSATGNESAYISGTNGTKLAKEGKGSPVFCDYLFVVRPAMWIEAASISADEATETETIEEAEPEYTTLQKGSKGDDVKKLQERLNELGYSVGTVDGDFGGKTHNAVCSFQQDNELEATGIVDIELHNLIFVDTAKTKAEVEALKNSPEGFQLDIVSAKAIGDKFAAGSINAADKCTSTESDSSYRFYVQDYDTKNGELRVTCTLDKGKGVSNINAKIKMEYIIPLGSRLWSSEPNIVVISTSKGSHTLSSSMWSWMAGSVYIDFSKDMSLFKEIASGSEFNIVMSNSNPSTITTGSFTKNSLGFKGIKTALQIWETAGGDKLAEMK